MFPLFILKKKKRNTESKMSPCKGYFQPSPLRCLYLWWGHRGDSIYKRHQNRHESGLLLVPPLPTSCP